MPDPRPDVPRTAPQEEKSFDLPRAPVVHNIEFSCAPARSHVLAVGTWLKPALKEQRSG